MKTLRQSIILPVIALIAFLGFGAGIALADNSSEGVGGWNSEGVGAGQVSQVSVDISGNPFGIGGSGNAPATSHVTGSEPAGDHADGSEPKRRAFVGTLIMPTLSATSDGTGVTAESFDSFTLALQTTSGDAEVDISLSGTFGVTSDGRVDNPIFKFPGGPRAGTFTDGAKVVVLAQRFENEDDPFSNRGDEEDWQAVWVLIKPVRPEVPLSGVVVAVDGDEVTVETADGKKKTVTLPEHARGVGPGEVITVFRGNSGKAIGLVRASDVKNRLKKFLDDAEEEVDEPEEDEAERASKHDKEEARAERIAAFLARFSERQTRLIDRVMDRAPERVRVKLQRVRERIQAQRLEHVEAIERIRTKLDRIHPQHSHRGGNKAFDDRRPDNSGQGRPEGTERTRPERVNPSRGGDNPSSDDGRGRGRGRGGSTDAPAP